MHSIRIFFCASFFSLLLLSSCTLSDGPKEPVIKGVFLNTTTIPSAYSGTPVVVSTLDAATKAEASGMRYYKYAAGARILVEGKPYRFYIDTTVSNHEKINFWLFDTQTNQWSSWYHNLKVKEIQAKQMLVFNTEGLAESSRGDSIPASLSGYSQEINARMFLALITDSAKRTNPSYAGLIQQLEKSEFNKNPESGILAQKLASGAEVEFYKKEIESTYYPSTSTPKTLFVYEYVVVPGDSVMFTGRISGDSVIAFFK